MHVLVLGAGVIGVTTAWYLRKAGHQVTVIDRQSNAASETSYANGGQISVSHAEPWANPSAPLKLLRWLSNEDAPLLFRPRLDPKQWRWCLKFMLECLPNRTAHNIRQIVALGLYSRRSLAELRTELGIEYDQLNKGILHFYTSEAEFRASIAPAQIMRDCGCDLDIVSAEEVVRIEPALRFARKMIVGGSMTTSDESGDACKFTRALAEHAAKRGVDFLFNTAVVGLAVKSLGEASVRIRNSDGAYENLDAQACVVCLGAYSAPFLERIGVRLNIYPAKGYSVTLPIQATDKAPSVSLTDDEYKLVFSRLGDKLRIAGTAELNGYDSDLNLTRCRAIVNRTLELFPGVADVDSALYWTGLRPATPSNVPYIGKTKYPCLYVNTGHGTLGWTHSCGSGRAVADIVSGRRPELEFAFTGLSEAA
jgi:D-amino-acid dehydrogenase